jgi:hypothetical protein
MSRETRMAAPVSFIRWFAAARMLLVIAKAVQPPTVVIVKDLLAIPVDIELLHDFVSRHFLDFKNGLVIHRMFIAETIGVTRSGVSPSRMHGISTNAD